MCFTGSAIDRSAAMLNQKNPGFFAECLATATTRFVLLHRGSALCVSDSTGALAPRWLTLAELLIAGIRLELPQGVELPGHDAGSAITVLLGSIPPEDGDSASSGWRVAVEWGWHADAEAVALQAAVGGGASAELEWCGGRDLYHRLAWTDAAVIGHAVCATGWQLKTLRCGVTSLPTVPIEAGAKRSTASGSGREHRYYPRIDPCCIMLVVSSDRSRALLSHPARLRSGVWTCLAGFIDSCESVEEAVRRETLEEAGIAVGSVELYCSQPWPIGRGGAELMIACKAVATSSDVTVGDTAEYASSDDVRWFTRGEATKMLAAASEAYHHQAPRAQGNCTQASSDGDHTAPHPDGPSTLLTPGPYAVAYHLIKNWTEEELETAEEETEEAVPVAAAVGLSHVRPWEAICMFALGAAVATAVAARNR